MTAPQHHPSHELLLGYAAGALTDAVDLVVATHLSLCPTCRADVERLDAVGGALLEGAPPVEALHADDALDAIFDAPAAAPGPIVPPPPGPAWLPQPLRSRVGALPDHRWQRLVPGMIQQLPLPSDGGTLLVAQTLVSGLTALLTGALTTPFSAGVDALLYVDGRMRREGLDIQLIQSALGAAAPPWPSTSP